MKVRSIIKSRRKAGEVADVLDCDVVWKKRTGGGS